MRQRCASFSGTTRSGRMQRGAVGGSLGYGADPRATTVREGGRHKHRHHSKACVNHDRFHSFRRPSLTGRSSFFVCCCILLFVDGLRPDQRVLSFTYIPPTVCLNVATVSCLGGGVAKNLCPFSSAIAYCTTFYRDASSALLWLSFA